MLNIQINTRTSGKFDRIDIDGRSHIITSAMPIRGDITMNGIHYPDAEVASSFRQLNLLPAPLGHPFVNGRPTSIRHPVANNKHNIGAFLRNPRKKGKRVFVDFLLDETVANQSDEGKEAIRKIETGEKIGLSTGLSIEHITNKTGTDDFGKPFNREGGGFTFDHVAALLNDTAAGDHAGTELILNQGKDDELFVTNLALNELSANELHEELNDLIRVSGDNFTWVQEVFFDSQTFIYSREVGNDRKLFKQGFAIGPDDEVSLTGTVEEVDRKTEFVPVTNEDKGDGEMDLDKLVLLLVANSAFGFTVADTSRLTAMSETELVAAIMPADVTEKQARELLTNAGTDLEGYAAYVSNKEDFDAYLTNKEERLKTLRDSIVKGTDFTDEMLTNKSEDELNLLAKMIKQPVHVAEGNGPPAAPSYSNAETTNDYNFKG